MTEHNPALVEKAAEAMVHLRWPTTEPIQDGDREVARAMLDAVAPAIREAVIEDVARRFQMGGWTILTAPPRPGAIPSIDLGQRVTDWLRAQKEQD